jgi:hypothetical protein
MESGKTALAQSGLSALGYQRTAAMLDYRMNMLPACGCSFLQQDRNLSLPHSTFARIPQ